MNAIGALARTAREQGWLDGPAYLHDGTRWTHREVHSLGARLASVLRDKGVGPGDRVLLALPDSPVLVALFLGIGRLGAVAVLVNPYLRPEEYLQLSAGVAPLITVSDAALEGRFAHGGWAAAQDLVTTAEQRPEAPAVEVDDTAALYVQFTSGTTGTPKGAVHRHCDITAYHRAVGADMLQITARDVSLSISKMFFAYGFGNSLVYPLCSGSAAVLSTDRPTPAGIAELVERHGVTVLHGVPSAYANLIAETDPRAFRTVRVGVSAGERLPVPLGERAGQLLGAPVLDELGSTEIGGAFCANTLADNELGTIGRPLLGYEVEIRDRAGVVVPDGETGRLWVRGPTLLSEYLDAPEETERVLVGGWLSTNDTAVRRPDGRLVHTGRADDMEIVGGINVSPHEVESVLLEHVSVREVVVVAVPDERGASKLRAFAVSPVGEPGHAALERELIDLARGRLAAFKVPRSVTFVPALPRTFTGKVRRFVARTGAW